jgi:hypothetical protein
MLISPGSSQNGGVGQMCWLMWIASNRVDMWTRCMSEDCVECAERRTVDTIGTVWIVAYL